MFQSPPFVMVNKDKVGNERYRGFLPDMLKKLQERLEFQYELYEVEVRVVAVPSISAGSTVTCNLNLITLARL